MDVLRTVYRILHRDHLIWTMDAKSNLVIAAVALVLFLNTANVYTAAGNRIYGGFLLGISVGLFFGAYWHHAFSTHWFFYKKFYSAKTKNAERIKMMLKKLDYEIPTHAGALLLGFLMVYLAINDFVWLASSLFFGFIFGGALALAAVLNDLN
jgi:hypothetical protein